MRKVVYNACYGGFSLSDKALKLGQSISGNPMWGDWDVPRHDPVLVRVVETLGKEANGEYADLRVTTVTGPYCILHYNGYERLKLPVIFLRHSKQSNINTK